MEAQIRSNRKWAIVIGVGLALFPVHNKWLPDVTAINEEAIIFLPAFGTVIWILATLFFVRDHWRELDWGDKRVFVPLLVIAGAIGLSGIIGERWQDKIAPLLMGMSLFALYLVARKLGKDIFLPLAIGAVIASLGVITYGIIYPGIVTGGFVFEGNYDIVVGYVLLGGALFVHRYQWILASLALVAIFISGSPEGVFALGILLLAVLWRRDWGKRGLAVLVPLVLVVLVWFNAGYGQQLYYYTMRIAQFEPTTGLAPEHCNPVEQIESSRVNRVTEISAVAKRLRVAVVELSDLKALGEGYILTDFSRVYMIHNVPLVIVQQLGWPGILAGLAWLWVSIWCLVKTKLKYAWILVLALSVFDHFIWTQLAPLWWALAGVATTGEVKSDLIFKGVQNA